MSGPVPEYPALGFHFCVEFSSLSTPIPDTLFQEVSGLEGSIVYKAIKQGGMNNEVVNLPESVKFSNLVLRRALTKNSSLIEWVESALYEFKFEPRGLVVFLRNSEGESIYSWMVTDALPEKWSVSNFSADKNEVVIETLELNYRNFKRAIP